MDFFKSKALGQLLGDPLTIFILLAISCVLGLIIAITYRRTHRGFSYSQSYSITLVVLTVITTFIILLIEDSIARAVGIFGAFSIIRFRTAVKDVRDMAFVFFSLATGLAIGTSAIMAGVLGTIVISLLIILLHVTNFGGVRRLDHVLRFVLDAKHHGNDIFKSVFDTFLKKHTLLNVDSRKRGEELVFTFQLQLKDADQVGEFINALGQIKGVADVSVVSAKGDVEY